MTIMQVTKTLGSFLIGICSELFRFLVGLVSAGVFSSLLERFLSSDVLLFAHTYVQLMYISIYIEWRAGYPCSRHMKFSMQSALQNCNYCALQRTPLCIFQLVTLFPVIRKVDSCCFNSRFFFVFATE